MQVINFKTLSPFDNDFADLLYQREGFWGAHYFCKAETWNSGCNLKAVVNGLISQLQLFLLTLSLCPDFRGTLISAERRYWGTQLGFSKAHLGIERIGWILVAVKCLSPLVMEITPAGMLIPQITIQSQKPISCILTCTGSLKPTTTSTLLGKRVVLSSLAALRHANTPGASWHAGSENVLQVSGLVLLWGQIQTHSKKRSRQT